MCKLLRLLQCEGELRRGVEDLMLRVQAQAGTQQHTHARLRAHGLVHAPLLHLRRVSGIGEQGAMSCEEREREGRQDWWLLLFKTLHQANQVSLALTWHGSSRKEQECG